MSKLPVISNLSHLQAYARFFAEMTPETLGSMKHLLADDVVFNDPFNSLHGSDAFVAIFTHMYDVMENPRFDILDVAASEKAGYIKWCMTGALRSPPSVQINLTGMSEVHFDARGMVTAHYDHWDSAHQLLAKLPAIGWLVRRILKLFALPS
ncbi:MAG: hypothetical protein CMM80_05655 [Rhodospirillaceae bacterium]|nr:hypothetical protein [Rhodospirillaceae bacterium]|tara:strand:+ start:1275 stop:1730 length:456 start_codon:yes stop_codon:yes gene_type:complete